TTGAVRAVVLPRVVLTSSSFIVWLLAASASGHPDGIPALPRSCPGPVRGVWSSEHSAYTRSVHHKVDEGTTPGIIDVGFPKSVVFQICTVVVPPFMGGPVYYNRDKLNCSIWKEGRKEVQKELIASFQECQHCFPWP